MTHRYSRDNVGKRGTRWMLFHCAICGDLLQRYDVSVTDRDRKKHGLCGCTEELQHSRRWARKYCAEQAVHEAQRAASAPVTRPNMRDDTTKLGA